MLPPDVCFSISSTSKCRRDGWDAAIYLLEEVEAWPPWLEQSSKHRQESQRAIGCRVARHAPPVCLDDDQLNVARRWIGEKIEVRHVHGREFAQPVAQRLLQLWVSPNGLQYRWQILSAVAQHCLPRVRRKAHVFRGQVRKSHIGESVYRVLRYLLLATEYLLVLHDLRQCGLTVSHGD